MINGCPVCGNNQKLILVRTVTANESAEHFVRSAGAKDPANLEAHIENLWASHECSIVRCSSCASRFATPHVGGDSKFYSLAFPVSSYPIARWEFELTKKIASKSLSSGGRLLEVGGGSGAFLKTLMKEGLDTSRIVVTEYSADGAAALKKLGVNVYEVDFRRGVPGEPFRVVALFQTLEHLDRLNEVFKSLAHLTTSDAEIFISVPNVRYIDWQEQNMGIIDMPPNHITAFSEEGLRQLVTNCGWKVTSIKLQRKKSLVSRYKESALEKAINPSGNLELYLEKLVKIGRAHV